MKKLLLLIFISVLIPSVVNSFIGVVNKNNKSDDNLPNVNIGSAGVATHESNIGVNIGIGNNNASNIESNIEVNIGIGNNNASVLNNEINIENDLDSQVYIDEDINYLSPFPIPKPKPCDNFNNIGEVGR